MVNQSPPPVGPPPEWRPPGPYQPGGPIPYAAPPSPPRKSGGGLIWLLIGLSVLTVIGLVVGVGVVWGGAHRHRGDGSSESGRGSSAPAAEIASEGDIGPAGIITVEPTCKRWKAIDEPVANKLKGEWDRRDASIPARVWTPEQRKMYEAIAWQFTTEADLLVPLARKTPNRVVREIYSQIVAYRRAYAAAIPAYTPIDDRLAKTSNELAKAMNAICGAIEESSAEKRSPAVAAAASPTAVAPIGDLAAPPRFIEATSTTCSQMYPSWERLLNDLGPWSQTDSRIPAGVRSPADKAAFDTAAAAFARSAEEWEGIGRSSGNPVTEDFLVAGAQYLRAFVAAIPTSVPADDWLNDVGMLLGSGVVRACEAVEG